MRATKVLVVSPSRELSATLAARLSGTHFDIVHVQPGKALFHALRGGRPAIAVLDRIDERPEAAQLEIAVLKEWSPNIEVIALSRNSSERDIPVVEQGVFYYASEVSIAHVVRLIHAAGSTVASKREY